MDNQFRDNTKALIYNIFAKDSKFKKFSQDTLDTLSCQIEMSCNNSNIDKAHQLHIPIFWKDPKFVEQYSNVCYHVSINLDPESSVNNGQRYLIDQLLPNAYFIEHKFYDQEAFKQKLLYDIKKIGYMTSLELNPIINKQYTDQIEQRSNQTIQIKTTKMYLCPECKQRDAKFWTGQTRSGDEGYTVFIQCQRCWHNWKQY